MTNPTAWCLHCRKLRPIASIRKVHRYTRDRRNGSNTERVAVPLFARCIEGRFGCGHGCHAVVTLDVIEVVWRPTMTPRLRHVVRLMRAEAMLV
jgi:hypothetical protein